MVSPFLFIVMELRNVLTTSVLVMKGTKLRVEAEIGTLAVGEGGFIVLVPFARKSQQCTPVAMAEQGQIAESPRSSQVSTGVNSARRGITDNLSSIPSSPHAETASRYFSSGANSAWQDIMDDLSSISSSPQDDSASKNFCAPSTIPCSGNSVEDVSTDRRLPTGNSKKRRKPWKENGNAFNEMPTSGVNSAADQPSMDKKSSIARSAATSCHVGVHSSVIYSPVNLTFLTFIEEIQIAALVLLVPCRGRRH